VAEPTMLFAGVFDDSGKEHLVEAQYEHGKLMPVRGRSKLAYAFPWMPKKLPTYAAFAKASVEEIFGADRLAKVTKLAATELASGVFVNQGDGTFKFSALPRYAQMAPINAIIAADLDGDRATDLICVGNNFGPEPTTGRFDGGLGVFLKGDGKGGFAPVPPAESGLVVPGDARSAALIPVDGGKDVRLVVARCEGPVLMFAVQKK
jgi:hypothetical protein